MNQLKWYVSTLHVSTSNKALIRDLHDRCISSGITDIKRRKEIYTWALQYHKENQELYAWVYKGEIERAADLYNV